MEPYEDYVEKFNEAVQKLQAITPTISIVDDLPSEEEELQFVQALKEVMRLKNVLTTFSDFEFNDLKMDEQEFMYYRSKYLDLYDKVKLMDKKKRCQYLRI